MPPSQSINLSTKEMDKPEWGTLAPVAHHYEQTHTDGIVSNNYNNSELIIFPESNSQKKVSTNIRAKNQLIITSVSINSFFCSGELSDLLSDVYPFFEAKERYIVYQNFLNNILATSSMIIDECQIPMQSVHRAIQWLEKNGHIQSYQKITVKGRRGPKPTLYGLPGASDEQIRQVIQEQTHATSPSYKIADRLVQRSLIEVRNEEIQFSKIVNLARRNNEGTPFLELAEITAQRLNKQYGVKVWR